MNSQHKNIRIPDDLCAFIDAKAERQAMIEGPHD